MAKVQNGFAFKRKTIRINGMIRPSNAGGVTCVIRIDGDERFWQVAQSSPHAATYSAAISAMAEAHKDGVTHLTLQTPANLVRRQVMSDFKIDSDQLKRMFLFYRLYRIDFDDVDWIKGTA